MARADLVVASRAASRGWRALPVWGRLFVAWQVVLPVVMWSTGSQRFAWMMYREFKPPPRVLVQRTPGGAFEQLDLVRVLGHLRGELDYYRTLPGQLCRAGDIRAVKVIRPDGPAVDYGC
jgi:hypothetical protein